MASRNTTTQFLIIIFLLLLSTALAANLKKLVLFQPEPTVLKYHNGELLKGNITVNLIWYGNFKPSQHAIIVDFIKSLSPAGIPIQPPPSVASWWSTTEKYLRGTPCSITLGKQILSNYSLGKSLKDSQLQALTATHCSVNTINFVLTASDVEVEDFCMDRCGSHGWTRRKTGERAKYAYAWVGDSVSQCPGECAWPFYKPMVGPQTAPLLPPNGDVGIDGMVISLATVLAGSVTNPFDTGYFQGPPTAPLEAVSACTGMFGSGCYPGFPGSVMVDKITGGSYNAVGTNARKYLIPVMWDPNTSKCETLV